jgi:hypothetical protein
VDRTLDSGQEASPAHLPSVEVGVGTFPIVRGRAAVARASLGLIPLPFWMSYFYHAVARMGIGTHLDQMGSTPTQKVPSHY